MASPSEISSPEFKSPQVLAWLLRVLGAMDLAALVTVVLPWRWVAEIHQRTGLGALPAGQIVDYLVRTTPALYAVHGALLLYLSFDVVRYHPLIRFLGWLMMAHGLLLVFIDVQAGMPLWWTICEGPIFATLGLAMLLLPRHEIQRPRNGDQISN